MDTKFDISTDLEFYCFLKAHLPDEYEVLSEPRKSYYSEWDFDYKIYHQGQLFKEYAGDFREIEPGYLMKEAKQLLADIGGQSVNR